MKTLALLALLLVPALAHGQPAPTPPDPAQRCQALLSGTEASVPATVRAPGPATCEFGDLEFGAGVSHFHIDRLVLAGLADGTAFPPERLHAEAHGVRFQPRTDRPFVRWISQVTSRPFTVLLDYEHLPGGTLRIEQLALISPTLGVTTGSALLEGIDNLSQSTTARLRRLRLHMDGRGFFEAYVVPFAGGSLLAGEADPAAAFDADRQMALAGAQQALGGGAASPESLAAITRFLGALPHPDQPFDLFVDLPSPLSLAEPPTPDRLRTALPPGSVVATYGP